MNQLKLDLLEQVELVNDQGTPFNYVIMFQPGGFKLEVHVSFKHFAFESIELSSWDFSKECTLDQELNYAISLMSGFRKWGLFDGYRLHLAKKMIRKLGSTNYDIKDLAELFTLDVDILEAFKNGSPKETNERTERAV